MTLSTHVIAPSSALWDQTTLFSDMNVVDRAKIPAGATRLRGDRAL
jgi:hypothetical protein